MHTTLLRSLTSLIPNNDNTFNTKHQTSLNFSPLIFFYRTPPLHISAHQQLFTQKFYQLSKFTRFYKIKRKRLHQLPRLIIRFSTPANSRHLRRALPAPQLVFGPNKDCEKSAVLGDGLCSSVTGASGKHLSALNPKGPQVVGLRQGLISHNMTQ